MGNTARFATKQGTITVDSDAITIPRTLRRLNGTYQKSSSLLRPRWTIKPADVVLVAVSGHDRQYMTGARAVGVIATGGLGLLAPSRMRGQLVISTSAGDVFEFTLMRHDAKRPESVAAAFAARGYSVR